MRLERVLSLGGTGTVVSDFRYGDVKVRELVLDDSGVTCGRIVSLVAERVVLSGVRIDSVELDDCDLSALRWSQGRASRLHVKNCKMLGGVIGDLACEHVIFEDCKLDYTTFQNVRAAGPVVFIRSSLREAAFDDCDLSGCVFNDCRLDQAEFISGKYRGCDFRNTALASVRGITHWHGAVVDRHQMPAIAEAIASELDLVFGDEMDDTA